MLRLSYRYGHSTNKWGAAVNVISAEQAIAQGTTPEQTIMVAEWHENRARVIGKVLKDDRQTKKVAFGDRVTAADRERHLAIARRLRELANEIEVGLRATAA